MGDSVLAGVFISLAGLGYLCIGGALGACLFGVGLLGVIFSGSLLYTGKIYTESSPTRLALILLGNILGCFLFGFLIGQPSFPEASKVAEEIIAARINDTLPALLGKGICCGILMTTAVLGMRKGSPWALLLGIPMFILSGFYHSVADFFYFSMSPDLRYLPSWGFIVLGNYIGGKLAWIKKSEAGNTEK